MESLHDVKGTTPVQEDKSKLPDPKQGQFKIVKMTMRDATDKSKGLFWTQADWDLTTEEEQKVTFPESILKCGAIGREITFYSEKPITGFEIVQKMSIGGNEIEQLAFQFGFVIPKSTNSWE